ncbi:MAG: hypothetical protein GQ563_04090, partial [Desulfuromusa sp.]|nr:hypothetical protein [Desulfuromusa sp.]
MKIYKLSVQIVIIGSLSFCLLSGCNRQEDSAAQTAVRPEKVVSVNIEHIALDDLIETFILPATLEAWEDLTLAAEIAGSVRKIHFK